MKELKSARICLEKATKEPIKGRDITSYMFQFCKQMEAYLKNLAKKEKDNKKKTTFKKEAEVMNKFAKIYKNIKPKNCETCRGEGVCWLLSPCPDCDEGKKIKKIGKRVTKDLVDEKIKSKKRRNPH